MKVLNKQASAVFLKLIEGIDGEKVTYKKIDNTNGTFMPVSIDFIADTPKGKMYAIAHNFIQNGDVMADPDMQFIVLSTLPGFVQIMPMTYQLDNLGIFTEAAYFDEKNRIIIHLKSQADITTFANTWMKNIKEQKGIDIKPKVNNNKEHIPSTQELEEMLSRGISGTDCPEGCEVEIDGRCSHGYNSWFLQLGLV